jgi:cysteine desulfurase
MKVSDMAKERLFFDNASTTRIDPEVLKEMEPYLKRYYGNPSSIHDYGEKPKKAIEKVREQVSDLIGANKEEIYFTSCGTESNNFALWGLARAYKDRGNHIISSAIEHASILNPLKELKKEGWKVSLLPVDEHGLINPEDVKKEITKDTVLISVMHANNEVGTIQKIKEISDIAREKNILLHSDGMAAAGMIPVDVARLGVDSYSLSAQQMYGPKGAAALYVKKGIKIKPLLLGGIQESGRRAGTENVPAIAGFGKACEMAGKELDKNIKHLSKLQQSLIKGIKSSIKNVKLNGHPTKRIPGNVHISFDFIEGESILLMLNLHGIAAASGSSCTSQALKSSHVLLAMNLSPTMAQGSILFSLGKYNTQKEVDRVLEVLPSIIDRLRKMSPLYKE